MIASLGLIFDIPVSLSCQEAHQKLFGLTYGFLGLCKDVLRKLDVVEPGKIQGALRAEPMCLSSPRSLGQMQCGCGCFRGCSRELETRESQQSVSRSLSEASTKKVVCTLSRSDERGTLERATQVNQKELEQPMTTFRLTSASLLMWLAVAMSSALAADQKGADTAESCGKLFSEKKFTEASSCFVRLAKATATAQEKGRFLRNAIISLESQGKALRAPIQRAYTCHQILKLLKAHERQRLPFRDGSEKRQYEQKKQTCLKRAGYGQITVVSRHEKAKICVTGGADQRTPRCQVGSVHTFQRLLPGAYNVNVAYPLNPPMSATRAMKLGLDQKLNLLFDPPYVPLNIVTNDAKARVEVSSRILSSIRVKVGKKVQFRLPLGSHKVRVFYPNYPPKTKQVRLSSTSPDSLVFSPPPPVWIQVKSEPVGTKVYINKTYYGQTPLRLRLQAGGYQMELLRPCFLGQTRSIKVQAQTSGDQVYSFKLLRDPVWKLQRADESQKRVVAWSALGVAGGVLGVSVGLLIYGQIQVGDAKAILEGKSNNFNIIDNPDKYKEFATSGNTFTGTSLVGFGLSAAIAGFGFYYMLSASPKPESQLLCQTRTNIPKDKETPTKNPQKAPKTP